MSIAKWTRDFVVGLYRGGEWIADRVRARRRVPTARETRDGIDADFAARAKALDGIERERRG